MSCFSLTRRIPSPADGSLRLTQGYQRESNKGVNTLLKELEYHDGVVIFATNLWANFDPAFQRRKLARISSSRCPACANREMIWKAQLHPTKTPLAPDVHFQQLAEQYEGSPAAESRSAVIKAANMAAAEDDVNYKKCISQHHFEDAVRSVIESKEIMDQSQGDIAGDGDISHEGLLQQVEELRVEIAELRSLIDKPRNK